MLTALRLQDYKSYRGSVELPLRRVTILLGKNNSGKTAAARLPLLLFGSFGQRVGRRRDPLPRAVRGLAYGTSMLELVHGESPHSRFGIGCTTGLAGLDGPVTLSVEIQLRQTLSAGITAFVAGFSATPVLPSVAWNEDLSQAQVDYGSSVDGFEGVIPRFASSDLERKADQLRRSSARRLDELVHLTSLRRPLMTLYENRSNQGDWDPQGSDVPFLLNESDEILSAVRRWYDEELDTRIELSQESAAFRLVTSGRGGSDHTLARAGQGIQQVLPVVTHLCGMALGIGTRLLVIEEPELNLHPAAHGALGDLIAAAVAADSQGQVIIETHSENLLLRLRYRVATGELDPGDVNILWFEQADDGTKVEEIHVRHDGSLSDWPSGVFSEDLAEVRAIARTNRQ